MSWPQVADALSVLALVADLLVLTALAGFLISRLTAPGRDLWKRARDGLAPYALPAAFAVAVVASAGSLYFQYGAGFVPCALCWYQRICMYPETLLLGIATFRRDLYTARRFVAPLALCGALLSVYHYQLERFPTQPTVSCGIGEPVCSAAYFNIFGFISIAYMALSAFLLIATLLLLAREPEPAGEEEGELVTVVSRERPGVSASAGPR
ncbi:MAG TPA: disulfide bond formation protein B [Candidatus Binatia bacterium]|nr:disulfide bond formation protein B [Candidatus Binatia bacterium]